MPLDDETLARAMLTFCLNDADAIMFATIKGTGCAREALRLIERCSPRRSGPDSRAARRALDESFAKGLIRWGRQANARSSEAFRLALARWHARLDLLPSLDADSLRAWFTADGTQWIIGPDSPLWPHQLDDLSIRRDWAPPLCLWGIGDPAALTSCPKPLAVVGSRGADEYGLMLARAIGERAAARGHLVVSGGAMGADAAAHWGTLSTVDSAASYGLSAQEIGRTVAVFAGGLNHVGPQCNHRLFKRIVGGSGALVSELCPDTIPEGRRFLLRNRLIASLASTVVVTQARLRSGALNTAHWAAELSREVYAAPGNAGMPYNAGCNRLIRDNEAMLLMSADEIDDICHAAHRPTLAETSDPRTNKVKRSEPSERQEADSYETQPGSSGDTRWRPVLDAIRRCRQRRLPATAENIASCADGMSLPETLTSLGWMELDGLIAISHGVVIVNARRDDADDTRREAGSCLPLAP
ncbi:MULTISPECIES: DNA-processing protein DprA [Bifidobacterium]|uniref:DNA-processing protein DprA n=1 Tax=Bifidobacterium TaxID=1678 RepID=UPI001BDD8F17|nr:MULTISPECIES: DNA-processing protein DprA [Bifidobacterium]MBT1161601.1 DNA-protecting protein DprA [Bifidobacterium sp. SO1]MBW3078785.1 DNA-protecting protein DprA [Bifidobacterium simiiventris]